MKVLDSKASRRRYLAGGSLLSALGSLSPLKPVRMGTGLLASSLGRGAPDAPNIYGRLGVRTRINAKGTYTYLSGSLLPPEVAQAMEEADSTMW